MRLENKGCHNGYDIQRISELSEKITPFVITVNILKSVYFESQPTSNNKKTMQTKIQKKRKNVARNNS